MTSYLRQHTDRHRSFEVVFTYAEGPPSLLSVYENCSPGAFNGALGTDQQGAIVAVLAKLVEAH